MSSTPPNPLPPDENVGPVLLTLTAILTAIAVSSTGLRLWVRHARYSLGSDDYTMAAATVLAIARMAIQIVQVQNGNGRHRWYITNDQYMFINELGWVAQILLFADNALLKISICLLILRIKSTKWLKWLLYTVMGGLAVTNALCIIVLLAECDPVKTYWDSRTGHCWDSRVRIYSIYFTIAFGVVTDILLACLPIVVVWKVQIPVKTKVAVCGLMALGLTATGFGIARAASLGLKVNDLSWTYCIAAIWSNLELYLGIIAANLALARSMFLYFREGSKALASRVTHSGSRSHPGLSQGGNNFSRKGYINQSSTNDRSGNDMKLSTMGGPGFGQGNEVDIRRGSYGTNASDRPFYGTDGIKKTMDFYIDEGHSSNSDTTDERSPPAHYGCASHSRNEHV